MKNFVLVERDENIMRQMGRTDAQWQDFIAKTSAAYGKVTAADELKDYIDYFKSVGVVIDAQSHECGCDDKLSQINELMAENQELGLKYAVLTDEMRELRELNEHFRNKLEEVSKLTAFMDEIRAEMVAKSEAEYRSLLAAKDEELACKEAECQNVTQKLNKFKELLGV